MNVDSIIPKAHFAGKVLAKFNSARIAPFCTPTQAPTKQPTQPSIQTPEQKFDLTKISKPVAYISLLGLIGSILLLFF